MALISARTSGVARLALPVSLLLTASMLAACGVGGSSSSDESVKVALIGEQTGSFGPTFLPAALGAQAAFKKINADGGINGKQVDVQGIFDSRSSTEGGVAAAQLAAGAEPDVIVSASASLAESGAAPTYDQVGLPVVSLSGSNAVASPPPPLFFGFQLAPSQVSRALIAEVEAKLGAPIAGKKVAIVGVQAPATDAIIADLQVRSAEDGFAISNIYRTPPMLTSFAPEAASIVADRADAVLVMDAGANALVEATALKVAGNTNPIVSAQGASADAVLQGIGQENFSAIRLAAVPEEGDALFKAAADLGVSADIIQTTYFSMGWALAYTTKAILEKCGVDCSPDAFAKAAESAGDIVIPDEALYGPVRFTKDEHYGNTSVAFAGWDGGKVTVGEATPLTD